MTPAVAQSGIPFVVGIAPIHAAEAPAPIGTPVLLTSWEEAVKKFGFSYSWEYYTLCEFMYSHFKLYGCQPVIFVNVLDPSTMKTTVAAADIAVTDHKVKLPMHAINDATLVVKPAGGTGSAYERGADYETFYTDEYLVVELLPDCADYDSATINIAYTKVNPLDVENTDIVTAFDAVELCATKLGIVPDLLCAPGFSGNSVVAATMATKASGINGLFTAKALCDVDCSASGAQTYDAVLAKKTAANLTDAAEIICWPMGHLGNYKFHLSTQLAGLMAQVDTGNGGCPYESPSNKGMKIDGLCLADGTDVDLTLTQANYLNISCGVVTALNFMSGWVAWGNYTACYPAVQDVKDYFIPVSRVFSWVGNTIVKTFWSKLDKPMNRRLIDCILDTANIWLNGLVGRGYLLGARVEMLEEENPLTDLMAGLIRLHVYMTPPSPAQEIDFVLEYDAAYVTDALS